jgi:spore coat protein U-like protein
MKTINSYLLCALVSSLTVLTSMTSFAQTTHSTTANAKATATLSAVCTIGSQNVNFGQIALPIGAQSSTSSMSVTCTKGSSYTIGLAYGGIYGTGASGNYWTLQSYMNGSGQFCQPFKVILEYNSAGSVIGSGCSNSMPTGTTYDSSTGRYNVGTTYGYGVMNGAAKGDSIAYFIQVPNNPSQVWNTGNYTYTSTGTGAAQSIPVVATLKPSNTPNTYPTADTYLDTVTATVNY